ncbi:hypothetical protein DD091_13725 [Clostridioides difficile]|nr:hypothetical protein [Clostridioides difficile]
MHFHAGKCQLMQGIFQKENTDKALKYGIYRHLPTYEKIIRNLVSFYAKKRYEVIKFSFISPFLLCIYINIYYLIFNISIIFSYTAL